MYNFKGCLILDKFLKTWYILCIVLVADAKLPLCVVLTWIHTLVPPANIYT